MSYCHWSDSPSSDFNKVCKVNHWTFINVINVIGKLTRYMGKVVSLGVWVPHVLSKNNKKCACQYLSSLLAVHLLASQQHRPFLSQIIKGEKWCFYVNAKNRKLMNGAASTATCQAKAGIHSRNYSDTHQYLKR